MDEFSAEIAAAIEADAGVRITLEIGRGARSKVFLAMRDEVQYAVKIPVAAVHDESLWTQFRSEASFLAHLDHPSLPKVYAVGKAGNIPYMILQYVEGKSLDRKMAGRLPSERELIQLAQGLLGALSAVHRRGLVHRDIKPGNIVVTEEFNPVLVDFGFAVSYRMRRSPKEFVGTLKYCSPEQAGTIKRAVDHRSDLYSLGIVLYEAATGHAPFESSVESELATLHVTHSAKPITELRSGSFSPVLQDFIFKLIAKDPDERYQSAESALWDLVNWEKVKREYKYSKTQGLGRHEFDNREQSEARLIGREEELKLLTDRWKEVKALTGSVVVVQGESGSGKTRLVRELLKRLSHENTPSIRTKCSQKNQLPFGPLKEIVEQSIDSIFELPVDRRDRLISEITKATREDIGILSGFSIKIDALFGSLPVHRREAESQEQVYGILSQFITRLFQARGPMLVFLDDVQWLDEASSQVIRRLVESIAALPVFIVFSSRLEISPSARRNLMELASYISVSIKLEALDQAETETLLQEFLGRMELEGDFGEKIFRRSGGNPFAIGQYVQSIIDSGLIYPSWGKWKLDSQSVDSVDLPDDLLALILSRMHALDTQTKKVLTIAAMLSNRHLLSLLPQFCETSEANVSRAIDAASSFHLIDRSSRFEFNFVHDKIQEALIAALSVEQKASFNYKIACTIEAVPQSERTPEMAYAIAQHFFDGLPLSSAEKTFEANLNAASTALSAYAVEDAYKFFRQTEELLPESNPAFSAEYFHKKAQLCILTSRALEAIHYLTKTLELTKDKLIRAQTRIELARVQLSNRKVGDSLVQVRAAFADLGVYQSRSKIIHALKAVWDMLVSVLKGSFRIRSISPRAVERMKVLVQCYEVAAQAAYFKGDSIFFLWGLQILRPAKRIGLSRELCLAYSVYGGICSFIKWSSKANELLSKGVTLAKQLGDPFMILRASVWKAVYRNFDGKWEETEDSIRQLLETESYIDATDYLNLCGCQMFQYVTMGSGTRVLQIAELGIKRLRWAQGSIGVLTSIEFHPYFAYKLPALAQLDRARSAAHIVRKCREQIESTHEDSFGAGIYFGSLLGFWYETGETGPNVEETIKKFNDVTNAHPLFTMLHTRHFFFYQAYFRLEQCLAEKFPTKEDIQRYRHAVRALGWATLVPDCPALKAHHFVARAGEQFLLGKVEKAMSMLARAEKIAGDRVVPLARFEAIRLRARIFAKTNRPKAAENEAKLALRQAEHFKWKNRERWIREEFKLEATPSEQTDSSPVLTKDNLANERYEGAILRVALAVGSRLDPIDQARSALDELTRALGAERAFLFDHDEELATTSFIIGRDLEQKDLVSVETCSRSAISKVVESKEAIVVTGDEYQEFQPSQSIIAHNLKSILVAPMMVEGHLQGIVYLDNRLVKGLFSARDLQLLQAISNQIAVARQSARVATRLFEQKHLKQNLNKFLPNSVVDEIVGGKISLSKGLKDLQVTVLFSDLVGFTRLVGSIPSSDASTIMNDFLNAMIHVIFKHGGTIDKFIGDAIMVIFGAPQELPPHVQVEKALSCAADMQKALLELNRGWSEKLKVAPISMRVGIHHGPVLIGNFGNDLRMEYTAFGNTVNLAKRIESICEPGQVYFSKDVFQLHSSVPSQEAGVFELKGIQGKATLYKLDLQVDSRQKKAA